MAKTPNNTAWWFLVPAIAMLAAVGLAPLISVISHSFQDIFTPEAKVWVGLEWYQEVLRSPHFLDSLMRSFLFSTAVLLVEIPLGIYIALRMPKNRILLSIALVLMSLPLLVPWNTIPIIWTAYIQADSGLLGKTLSLVGLELNWKSNPWHTWLALILMDTWHWTSLVVLLCYSSLTTISPAYYMAAAIDCASPWQVFRHIQFPKMKSVLIMAFMLRFMDSFMIYTEAFRFNAGGPNNATMFLAVDLGEDIAAFNYGPAAARSVIYFIIILSVAWGFYQVLRRHQHNMA